MDIYNGTSFIWKSFLSGDKEAFTFLYNLHVRALHNYGLKLCSDPELVKDAIQEVFLDLLIKRDKHNVSFETLRFYLASALKHNLFKKLKQNNRTVAEKKCELLFEPVYSIEHHIIENEEEAEINLRISEILKRLPAKQKEVIYLRFTLSLDYNEIAQLMNIAVESVRMQVFRALSAIREKLNK